MPEEMRSKVGDSGGGARPRRGAITWTLIYLALLAAPLLVLSSGLVAVRGSGWWYDFSMGIGFAALALIGGQFVLTARFRRATAPFGMDVLYLVHRWLAVVALLLAAVHYALLRCAYPATLLPASPLEAPFHMTAGRAALLAFALLVASSLWRRRLRIEYDRWRGLHILLAVGGTALAFVHVRGVAHYSDVFWTRILLDLLLGSLVAVVAYVRLVKPILLTGRPYRVSDVREERGRSWTLTLEPDGHDGVRFAPGQFAWLSLGHTPLRAREHPFSFSGSAAVVPTLEFTIKELGDFTRGIGRTPVGTSAYVDGPHGIFTVDRHPSAPGFLFIAGGVGIAPVVSMLRTLADRGDARPLGLVYGTRSWEATPLREEIARLGSALDLRLQHVLEEPHPGWEGAVGRPTPELISAAVRNLPAGAVCFMCGPPGLTRMTERALLSSGVSLRNIHVELFEMA